MAKSLHLSSPWPGSIHLWVAVVLVKVALAVGRVGTCSLEEFGRSKYALRIAVTECHQRFPEGATLIVPAGKWHTAAFNLTSNFTLALESGAALIGVGDFELIKKANESEMLLDEFPLVHPEPSYGHVRDCNGWPGLSGSSPEKRCYGVSQSLMLQHAPWIGGWNLSNVSIIGAGVELSVLDGNGQPWWTAFLNGCLHFGRPKLLSLQFSRNIRIRNLSVRNSPFWTLHMYASDNIHIADVDIHSPNRGAPPVGHQQYEMSPNADGIDLDSSTNALVEKVQIAAADDAIAVKSGMDFAGRLFAKPSANITIRDSVLVGLGVAIGSEMSGGVFNVTFENLVLPGAHVDPGLLGSPFWGGLHIKAGPPRGGEVKDIVFRNITVGAYRGAPFSFTMQPYPDFNMTPPVVNSSSATRVSNILLEDIHSNVVGSAAFIGYSEAWPMRNVTMRRVHLAQGQTWNCTHVHGVHVDDVRPPLPSSCNTSTGSSGAQGGALGWNLDKANALVV